MLRNYLLPRGLAEATEGRLRQQQQEKKQRAAKEAKKLKQPETAAALDGQKVEIAVRTGEGGRLLVR